MPLQPCSQPANANGPYRIWTGDLLHAMETLYQLSQRPIGIGGQIDHNSVPPSTTCPSVDRAGRYHWWAYRVFNPELGNPPAIALDSEGFEPSASAMRMLRSSQLSYEPMAMAGGLALPAPNAARLLGRQGVRAAFILFNYKSWLSSRLQSFTQFVHNLVAIFSV